MIKFVLPLNTSEDQLLYFANELELSVRQHDLIARIGSREFAVLLRFDTEIEAACEALIFRIRQQEKRKFHFGAVISDGTKGLVQVLENLDNPQILRAANTL